MYKRFRRLEKEREKIQEKAKRNAQDMQKVDAVVNKFRIAEKDIYEEARYISAYLSR